MKNLLNSIAIILLIIWAIGVFAYAVSGLIHAFLLLAIIVLLLNPLRRNIKA